MKTLMNYIVMIGLLTTSIVSAQVPQAFSYQAVIRDTTGVVIQDQLISLRISILKGEIHGEEVYQEIHDVTTDKFGLVSLNIGEGLVTTGSFSEIPWGTDKFFLQIEMDMEGAMNYQLLGTSQLMAVPYALYADRSGNDVWKKTDDGTIYYQDGKVGIGTTNPATYKFKVETTADGGTERAIALFRNNSTSTASLCNLYISSGNGGSTYLNFVSSSYIHQGGKYKSHTILGNNGKGLVFRTGQNDKGRVAFEFRRELGDTYTYDEKVSITYEGNMGIGTTTPRRKLHINDVMRLEPRSTAPDFPGEGDIYMDSNDHVLKVYNGTEWKACW